MAYTAVELIELKRDRQTLPADGIEWFIDAYTKGTIPDYQMAAMAMAIVFNGLDPDELAVWTSAMIASGDSLMRPNGITWDAANARFIVVAYGGRQAHFAWQPGSAPVEIGAPPGGRYDGVEVLGDGRMLVASQADSTIQVISGGEARRAARVSGAPADIGVDTRRGRVAVPFIALNRIEIHQLPDPE